MASRAEDTSLVARTIRAARLEDQLYREVASDPRAMPQAFFLVIAAAVLSGIGGIAAGPQIVVLSIVMAPFSWVVVSVIAHLIGRRVIGAAGTTGWEQVARALGFANAPSLLGAFAIIPGLGVVIAVALVVWHLAAMTVALRASMAISTGQSAMLLVLSAVTLGVMLLVIDLVINGFPAA